MRNLSSLRFVMRWLLLVYLIPFGPFGELGEGGLEVFDDSDVRHLIQFGFPSSISASQRFRFSAFQTGAVFERLIL